MTALEDVVPILFEIHRGSPNFNYMENFFALVTKQFVSGLSKKNIVRETYDGFVISVREIILGFSVENIHKIIESMVKTKTLIMESKDPE